MKSRSKDDASPVSVTDLKAKTVRGLSALIVREIGIKAVAIVGQLLLVRFLLPEQFGSIAIISFIINVGDLFTDVGLVSGVIRAAERPSKNLVSSLFYIKMILTSIVVFVICVLNGFWVKLFPVLQGIDFRILIVFSFTLLIRPLRTLMYGLLERDLNYKIIPYVDVGGLIVYFVVAIILAVQGMGIWSLVWSAVLKDLGEILILELFTPFFPSPSFSWKGVAAYVKFGAPLQLNNVLGFLQLSTIPLLGGMITSTRSVGLLDWGSNIASLPRALTDNISRVSYASFSRIQNQVEMLENAVESVISMTSLFILFLILASLLFGKEAIYFVIGSHWTDAAPALTWLLISELSLSVVGVVQQVVVVCGFTRQVMWSSLFSVIMQTASAFVLTRLYGFVGIAIAITLGWTIQALLLNLVAFRRGIRFRWFSIFKRNMLIFFLALASGVLLTGNSGSFTLFILKMTLFTLVYGVLVLVLARSVVLELLTLLHTKQIKLLLQMAKHLAWEKLKSIYRRSYSLFRAPVVHVIGDSHTQSFESILFETHHLGPVTAYKLDSPESTTGGRQKVFKLLDKLVRERQSRVLFVFGEIDCRIHINKARVKAHASRTEAVERAILPYQRFLLEVQKAYPSLQIAICNVFPPGEQGNIYKVSSYAARPERLQITIVYNALLKEFCKQNNFFFLSLFDELIDSKTTERKLEFVFDDTHFNHKIVPLARRAINIWK